MADFYSVSIEDTFKTLRSSAEGLDESEVKMRLQKHGLSELQREVNVRPQRALSWIILVLDIMSRSLGKPAASHEELLEPP